MKETSVPRWAEFKKRTLFKWGAEHKEIKEYLPDYDEKTKINRMFLFNVMESVKSGFISGMVSD